MRQSPAEQAPANLCYAIRLQIMNDAQRFAYFPLLTVDCGRRQRVFCAMHHEKEEDLLVHACATGECNCNLHFGCFGGSPPIVTAYLSG